MKMVEEKEHHFLKNRDLQSSQWCGTQENPVWLSREKILGKGTQRDYLVSRGSFIARGETKRLIKHHGKASVTCNTAQGLASIHHRHLATCVKLHRTGFACPTAQHMCSACRGSMNSSRNTKCFCIDTPG